MKRADCIASALRKRPAGSRAVDGCDVVIDDRVPGWERTALTMVTLPAGESLTRTLGSWEAVVVPLAGPGRVEDGFRRHAEALKKRAESPGS